jgi:hypothetical protein
MALSRASLAGNYTHSQAMVSGRIITSSPRSTI